MILCLHLEKKSCNRNSGKSIYGDFMQKSVSELFDAIYILAVVSSVVTRSSTVCMSPPYF